MESESSHGRGVLRKCVPSSSDSDNSDAQGVRSSVFYSGQGVALQGKQLRGLRQKHQVVLTALEEQETQQRERDKGKGKDKGTANHRRLYTPRRTSNVLWKALVMLELGALTWSCSNMPDMWTYYEPWPSPQTWPKSTEEKRRAKNTLAEVPPDLLVVHVPQLTQEVDSNTSGKRAPQEARQHEDTRRVERRQFSMMQRLVEWQKAEGRLVMMIVPVSMWDHPVVQSLACGMCAGASNEMSAVVYVHNAERPFNAESPPETWLQQVQDELLQTPHEAYPAEGLPEDDEEENGWQPPRVDLHIIGAEAPAEQNPPPVEADQDLPADADPAAAYESLEEEIPLIDREKVADVPKEIRAAVKRVHCSLGHPPRRTLLRLLSASGAPPLALLFAKYWNCSMCLEKTMPSHPPVVSVHTRPTRFGDELHLDLKYVRDVRDELHVFLSLVDAASSYHVAVLLKTRQAEHVASKVLKHWIMHYGCPRAVVHDLGGEFGGAFAQLLEALSVPSRVTAAHSPWSNGFIERQGGILAFLLSGILWEFQVETKSDLKLALASACMAKNAQLRRCGYSPESYVFGRALEWIPALCSEDSLVRLPSLNVDSELWRAASMRAAASRAFHRLDVSDRMRRALLRSAKPRAGSYTAGELVYFWTPAAKKGRCRPDPGRWRGPALVIMAESERKLFLSWRGRLLLTSAEQLRPASPRERKVRELLQEEKSLHGGMQPGNVARALDLRHVGVPEAQTEASNGEGTPPQAEVVVPRNVLGESDKPEVIGEPRKRKLLDASRLRALREQRAALETDTQAAGSTEGAPDRKRPRKVLRIRRQRTGVPSASMAEDAEPAAQRRRLNPPQDPLVEEVSEADFWQSVHREENRYVQEDPTRPPPEQEQPYRDDYSDVPLSFRRHVDREAQLPVEGSQRWPGVSAGLQPEAQQSESRDVSAAPASEPPPVDTAYASHEQHCVQIASRTLTEMWEWCNKQHPRQDRWLGRVDLRLLSRLLQRRVLSAKWHGLGRKDLLPHPHQRELVRLTVATKEKGDKELLFLWQEADEQSQLKRLDFKWRGMSIFMENATAEQRVLSIALRLPDGRRVLSKVYADAYEDVRTVLREWQQQEHEAYVLKNKKNNKELDPSHFDESEAKAFEASDLVEWEQWLANGVVEVVPPEREHLIDQSRVFPIPTRMIRVSKSKPGEPLRAKSRMVLPGHRDPALGEAQTDSPTVPSIMLHMALTWAASKGYSVRSFDVQTAFLSGRPIEREVYFRTPQLPASGKHGTPPLPHGTLLHLLKGAYGLSEAPHLWFLQAKRLLEECGFKELMEARACFIYCGHKGGKSGDGTPSVKIVLLLHVDDGLMIADFGDKESHEVFEKVNARFSIKEWSILRPGHPLTYLGLQIRQTQDGFTLCMQEYVEQKIQLVSVPRSSKDEEVLTAQQQKDYRSLLQRLAWPSRHVGIEHAYDCSSMAARSSEAKIKDLKELNALARRVLQSARAGEMVLHYQPIDLVEPWFVTTHDASFARETNGRSQAGHIVGITDKRISGGAAPFNVVCFNTHRLRRVVKSTLAAEASALVEGLDTMLYVRTLWTCLTNPTWVTDKSWQEKLAEQPGASILVTDGRSLYDSLTSTASVPQEKQIHLDLLFVRELVERKLLQIRWVPGVHQLSDVLTKHMAANAVMQLLHTEGTYSLVQTPENKEEEARKALLRKQQRGRYKQKSKDERLARQQVETAAPAHG
eukprot:5273952-Amphidinium_carterae.1